jgi:hypothetical protein
MKRGKTTHTGGSIVIRGGAVIDKLLARIVCRCAECLGPVELHNNGLACVTDKSHTGLIHRTEAAAEQVRRDAQLAEVEQVYFISADTLFAFTDYTERN